MLYNVRVKELFSNISFLFSNGYLVVFSDYQVVCELMSSIKTLKQMPFSPNCNGRLNITDIKNEGGLCYDNQGTI